MHRSLLIPRSRSRAEPRQPRGHTCLELLLCCLVHLLPPELAPFHGAPAMTVSAPYVALRDLGHDAATGCWSPEHRRDVPRLAFSGAVVELKATHVCLTAVDARVREQVLGNHCAQDVSLGVVTGQDPCLVHRGVLSIPGLAALPTSPLAPVLGRASDVEAVQGLHLAAGHTSLHDATLGAGGDSFALVPPVGVEPTIRRLKGACIDHYATRALPR